MRIDHLADTIIASDAKWFHNNNFITDETYNGILAWLNGKDDPEILDIVISWMEKDQQWLKDVDRAFSQFFWYIYPAFKTGAIILDNKFNDWLAELNDIKLNIPIPKTGISPIIPILSLGALGAIAAIAHRHKTKRRIKTKEPGGMTPGSFFG